MTSAYSLRLCALLIAYLLAAFVPGTNQVGPVYTPDSPEKRVQVETALPTVTVHGFSNFKTTVDGTVIIFTPSTNAASEPSIAHPAPAQQQPVVNHKVDNNLEQKNNLLQPPQSLKDIRDHNLQEISPSSNEIVSREPSPPLIQSSFTSGNAHPKVQKNTQSPSTKTPKLTSSSSPENKLNAYPTGLVTVLGGTQVNTGVTTVFETKVIGTYINGNYAQILQSTSKIFPPEPKPSSAATITPSKVSIPQIVSTSAAPEVTKSRPRHRQVQSDDLEKKDQVATSSNRIYTSFEGPGTEDNKVPSRVNDIASKPNNDVEEEKPSQPARQQSPRTLPALKLPDHNTNVIIQPSTTRLLPRNITRRRFNRPDRFRFRNNPRPKAKLVQLNRFKVRPIIRSHKLLSTASKTEANTIADVLQKSIPIDPGRVIWETSVVTKEVTLHLGRRKSVRTFTVTTTVPVTLDSKPTISHLGDDIYASPAANNHLAATTPPFGDFIDGVTPPMRVLTRTFSETEVSANTALVPVFDGESTTMHTVTESYFIRKMITAYRTMPPGEVYHEDEHEHDHESISPDASPLVAESQLQTVAPPQIPSNSLGNKLPQPVLQTSGLEGLINAKQALNSQAYLSQLGSLQASGLQPLNPLLTLGAALSSNPLAAAYLGLNLGLQPQLYSTSTITKSSSFVTTDTVYSTKVLRIYDGKRTIFRTLSEPLSTTERTVTSYQTETVSYLNTQVLEQQQKQLQQLIAPSLPPQYSTVTSTYTTVTQATSYSSKIYRLVYNAFSTKFRTVTSSSVYDTTVTTSSTSKIPIQATNFPILG